MENIKRHFTPPSNQSYFLFGPRGTGKTKILREIYQNAVKIDLLDERKIFEFNAHPENLEKIVLAMKDGEHLILDEVQKAPNLLAKIHQMMESPEYPRIIYVLTGSSARKLKRDGVDLLSGRAIIKNLYPFTAKELGGKFNLEERLKLGMLPLVWASTNPVDTLESYIALYLREEIKLERVVKKLETFSRFLEAMAFSHAELLNISNVSRECGVKRSTCDGHLEILEDLLLGHRLQPFKIKNRKQTVSSEKFYYFDSGVFLSLHQVGPLTDNQSIMGRALEGFIEQHLQAYLAYRNCNEKLYFWRTKAGAEVDFILYGKDLFHAIEVKASNKIIPRDLVGLKSFLEDYPTANATLVYNGKYKVKHDNIMCIPVEEFLLNWPTI